MILENIAGCCKFFVSWKLSFFLDDGNLTKTAEFVTPEGVFGSLPDIPIATASTSAVQLNQDEILFLARIVASLLQLVFRDRSDLLSLLPPE